MENAELIRAAAAVRDRAYAPYSKYKVGAALLGTDGKLYTGCNMESAAFGAGICAERNAMGTAVANGCRSFVKAAVISNGTAPCTPCGVCRQLLAEFSPDAEILCCREDGTAEVHTVRQLLPFGFGADSMESLEI